MGEPILFIPERDAADSIIRAVAKAYSVSPKMILSKSRRRKIAYARQAACFYLRRTHTPVGRQRSYPEIGLILKRDHATVIHGERAHEKRMKANTNDLKGAA